MSSAGKSAKGRNVALTASIIGACVIAGLWYWYNTEVKPAAPESRQLKVKEEAEELSYGTPSLAKKTKDDVIAIMDRVIEAQLEMRAFIRGLVQDIIKGTVTQTEAIYNFIVLNQPRDPLKEYGLTMTDFDKLMSAWQGNAEVDERIRTIVQGSRMSEDLIRASAEGEAISADQVFEIHRTSVDKLSVTLEELKQLQKRILSSPDTEFDGRAANLTIQARAAELTERDFGISEDVVEYAVLAHQQQLMCKPEFISIHQRLQEILEYFN